MSFLYQMLNRIKLATAIAARNPVIDLASSSLKG